MLLSPPRLLPLHTTAAEVVAYFSVIENSNLILV